MAKKNDIKNVKAGTAATEKRKTQTFTLVAPTASKVLLAGDFTRWEQHPVTMQKDENGIWHAQCALARGQHPYRFLVDGQWQDDPACQQHAPNPFGGMDAIREVT